MSLWHTPSVLVKNMILIPNFVFSYKNDRGVIFLFSVWKWILGKNCGVAEFRCNRYDVPGVPVKSIQIWLDVAM